MIKDVIVEDAGKKGKGVFALRNFKKGEFIFHYKKGRIVHRKDFAKLSHDNLDHLNEVDYDTFEIMRTPEKFINHSCEPNSIVKGRYLFALKAIKKGEEITGDYRINAFAKDRWRCYCGSKSCTGWIVGDFFSLPEKLQKKYLPYTIKVIREEYKRRHRKKVPHCAFY